MLFVSVVSVEIGGIAFEVIYILVLNISRNGDGTKEQYIL